MLVTHLLSTYPCDFVTSLFTSVDYKTVTFSVFCLSLVFLLRRKTRKYLRKEMSKRGLKFIVFVQCSQKPLRFFCPINSKWPKPFRCQTTGSRDKERRSCGPAKFGRAIAQRPMTSLELSFSCRSMRSTTILERAATAFGQNAPSFSPGCVLITFSLATTRIIASVRFRFWAWSAWNYEELAFS